MGRQYVRQSFSSASCAAGDSPCASSTTLQCVVANSAGPWTVSPVALSDVNECSAGGILPSKQRPLERQAWIEPAQICFESRLKSITVQFDFFGECFLYDSPLLVVEHFLIWPPVGAIFRF